MASVTGALHIEMPTTPAVEGLNPVTVALYTFAGIVFAGIQALLLTSIQGWQQSRKEQRDIKAAADKVVADAKIAADKVAADAEIRRKEKEEDYRRQDQVADRAIKAATMVADKVADVAKAAAEADKHTQAQLKVVVESTDKIHKLVNSEMTAARIAERSAFQLGIVQARRLKANVGDAWTPEEEQALKDAEMRVVELDKILADRAAAQKEVDEQTAQLASQIAQSAEPIKVEVVNQPLTIKSEDKKDA